MSFLIPCPNCGRRSVYEFRFGGEVKARPEAGSSDEAWLGYSYAAANRDRSQKEWWFHTHGCRQWLFAVRDTVNNEVTETSLPEEAP